MALYLIEKVGNRGGMFFTHYSVEVLSMTDSFGRAVRIKFILPDGNPLSSSTHIEEYDEDLLHHYTDSILEKLIARGYLTILEEYD